MPLIEWEWQFFFSFGATWFETYRSCFPLFDIDDFEIEISLLKHCLLLFGRFRASIVIIRSCYEYVILTRKSHNCAGTAFVQGDSAGGSKFIEQTFNWRVSALFSLKVDTDIAWVQWVQGLIYLNCKGLYSGLIFIAWVQWVQDLVYLNCKGLYSARIFAFWSNVS